MRRAQQLIACVALTACTHVAPYDRARLAHPTMIDEPTGRAATHVQTVTEGATGSGSIVESGCGCN
ncbi:MAG TPA: DUF4266 domain-containing protein [Polyangiaceae bacterium]|nr:DUF4266 domain-containing protein [Polyangiaceae bacterium]